MVWTVSQTASTLTLTPDGTTSANLSDLLDLAISTLTTNAGVTKPTLYTYDLTKTLLIGTDTSNNYLYVSGIELIVRNQFVRAANSRVRFANINASGAVVGKANIILNRSLGGFNFASGVFTISGANAYLNATDLTMTYRKVDNSEGSIVYGYDVANYSAVGVFDSCAFQCDHDGSNLNAIFFLGAESYNKCSFTGWAACEITNTSLVMSGCTFTKIGLLKITGGGGTYYLEKTIANSFAVQYGGTAWLTDCDINTYLNAPGGGNAGDTVVARTSVQLNGGANEANGLFVIRLPSNIQIYKRTLSAVGAVSGGNSTGSTNGTASSSDRLLISVRQLKGNPLATVYDYGGTWEGVFVKYGRLPSVFSFNLQGTIATLQNVPFASIPDAGITVSNSATIAAYTTIAINHATSLVTISGATTKQQLHDYCALEKASFADSGLTAGGNPVAKACLPTLGSDSVTLAAGKNITLAAAGTYTTSPIEVSSTSIVTVAPGNTDLRGWIFAVGATINVSSGTAIVTVDAAQVSNIAAGTGVTIQAPVASISAPNFAQNTRVQVARLEPYSVPSTAIATATGTITIPGNRFKSASPATLVYFQLQAGATIPTTSPQIANNTLYFVQASGVADGLTAGQFKISLTQSGAAIAFSTQGSGNFTITGITELDNSLAGAGGYSVALAEPNGTLLRVSAQSWQNAIGCTAGNFYQQSIIWNSTDGNAIADTVSVSANPDIIHNSLIGNSARVFNTNVTLPSDGSTVTGISFNAQGIISLDPRSFASVAGFPTITPQAAYLYTVYYRSTAAGIRVIANQFSAQDAANFAFSGLKLDNIADGIRNTPNTAAMIAGGYIATIDGSNPISPASGAIYLNADRRGVLVTTTSGATIAPTQQQLRDAQALTLSAGVVAATGSIDSKLALIPTSDNAPFVAAIKGQTDKLAFTTANRVDSTAIGVPTNPLVTTDSRLNNLDALVSSRASTIDLNAIPTNPLITTDSRLSNLDALISSRATQVSINALPTLTAIEGSIVLFKTNNYTAPDNAGIGSLNSKLTTIRTDGLDRLPNLDALITSRATPDQVWAVPYSGLTQVGTIGRMLYWVGKLFGATPTSVTASIDARTTGDGTINQTITTNSDGSKTMSGNP